MSAHALCGPQGAGTGSRGWELKKDRVVHFSSRVALDSETVP